MELERPKLLTPRARAQQLLREIRTDGWEMEFTTTVTGRGRVHVVAPDIAHPGYADVVEALMIYKVMAVCGRLIRRDVLRGRIIGTPFDDNLLCWACHTAFVGEEEQSLIFEYNVEPPNDSSLWAPSVNDGIRQGRDSEADRRAKAA